MVEMVCEGETSPRVCGGDCPWPFRSWHPGWFAASSAVLFGSTGCPFTVADETEIAFPDLR